MLKRSSPDHLLIRLGWRIAAPPGLVHACFGGDGGDGGGSESGDSQSAMDAAGAYADAQSGLSAGDLSSAGGSGMMGGGAPGYASGEYGGDPSYSGDAFGGYGYEVSNNPSFDVQGNYLGGFAGYGDNALGAISGMADAAIGGFDASGWGDASGAYSGGDFTGDVTGSVTDTGGWGAWGDNALAGIADMADNSIGAISEANGWGDYAGEPTGLAVGDNMLGNISDMLGNIVDSTDWGAVAQDTTDYNAFTAPAVAGSPTAQAAESPFGAFDLNFSAPAQDQELQDYYNVDTLTQQDREAAPDPDFNPALAATLTAQNNLNNVNAELQQSQEEQNAIQADLEQGYAFDAVADQGGYRGSQYAAAPQDVSVAVAQENNPYGDLASVAGGFGSPSMGSQYGDYADMFAGPTQTAASTNLDGLPSGPVASGYGDYGMLTSGQLMGPAQGFELGAPGLLGDAIPGDVAYSTAAQSIGYDPETQSFGPVATEDPEALDIRGVLGFDPFSDVPLSSQSPTLSAPYSDNQYDSARDLTIAQGPMGTRGLSFADFNPISTAYANEVEPEIPADIRPLTISLKDRPEGELSSSGAAARSDGSVIDTGVEGPANNGGAVASGGNTTAADGAGSGGSGGSGSFGSSPGFTSSLPAIGSGSLGSLDTGAQAVRDAADRAKAASNPITQQNIPQPAYAPTPAFPAIGAMSPATQQVLQRALQAQSEGRGANPNGQGPAGEPGAVGERGSLAPLTSGSPAAADDPVVNPYARYAGREAPESEVKATAIAILGEARGEGKEGWAAVAQNLSNRAAINYGKKGRTVEAQASSKNAKGNYEYSFMGDNNRAAAEREARNNSKAWQEAQAIAKAVLEGRAVDATKGATAYRAGYANSPWHRGLERAGSVDVGSHIFSDFRNAPGAALPQLGPTPPARPADLPGPQSSVLDTIMKGLAALNPIGSAQAQEGKFSNRADPNAPRGPLNELEKAQRDGFISGPANPFGKVELMGPFPTAAPPSQIATAPNGWVLDGLPSGPVASTPGVVGPQGSPMSPTSVVTGAPTEITIAKAPSLPALGEPIEVASAPEPTPYSNDMDLTQIGDSKQAPFDPLSWVRGKDNLGPVNTVIGMGVPGFGLANMASNLLTGKSLLGNFITASPAEIEQSRNQTPDGDGGVPPPPLPYEATYNGGYGPGRGSTSTAGLAPTSPYSYTPPSGTNPAWQPRAYVPPTGNLTTYGITRGEHQFFA